MLSRSTDPRAVEVSEGVRWLDGALIAYGRAFEHPSKVRIARWLVRRFAGGAVRVRYAPETVVAVDPSDYVGWAIFRTGHYEPASLNLALRIVRADPGLFVDVGAHFGWYTCAVSAVAGASVVSIEPDCENCAALRRNIALNGRENVTVFNGAVGAESAPVRIGRRARANSGTVAIDAGDSGRPGDWVATLPLGELLDRVIFPAVRPVLIKIDVEGFERQVLAGLDFGGPFRPKNILMEFDRALSVQSWSSLEDLHAFFAARGYELRDVFGQPLLHSDAIAEANVWARDRNAA
jgi:FkbM family methyltransferase